MTPKEEAILLIDKFYDYVNCWDNEGNADYNLAKEYAKKCALIYAQGMLKILNTYEILYINIPHWQEVINEIEKS